VEENYILNGVGHGGIAQMLLKHDFDPGVLRPFQGKHGKTYVELQVRNRDGTPVWDNIKKKWATEIKQTNVDASLRKDEWIALKAGMQDIQYPQLRFYADLRAAVTGTRLSDAWGQTILRRQRMGDISGASIGMTPLRKSERDLPEFDYVDTPLPIIYKHFAIDIRELATSRRRGEGLNTITARKMTRKCAEETEDRATGVAASFSLGTGITLYGLTNHPNRNTKVLTNPATAVGWTPEDTLDEVLDMIQSAQNDDFNGPYILYYSRLWTKFLGGNFSPAYGGGTMWRRLEEIPDIGAGNVRRLNRLTGYQMVLVQMTDDVVEPIIGLEIQPVQYPNTDPFELQFAVISMLLTEVKSEANGNSGVVHGTAA
jgi:hypothetical protein